MYVDWGLLVGAKKSESAERGLRREVVGVEGEAESILLRRPAAQAAAIEKGGRFALVGRVQLSQFLHKIIGVLRSRARCQRFRRFSFARARRPSA